MRHEAEVSPDLRSATPTKAEILDAHASAYRAVYGERPTYHDLTTQLIYFETRRFGRSNAAFLETYVEMTARLRSRRAA